MGLWLVFILIGLSQANPSLYHIGAVLGPGDRTSHFLQAVENLNAEPNVLPPEVTLEAITVPLDRNPIRTAQSVCENLIANQVYAVIIGQPVPGDLSPAAVSYTCGFYNIPVIGISSRDSSLSDKNLHRSFMRTVPPFSHQADVWIELLRWFRYKCVAILHSSDTDGRATLSRFQNLAHNSNIKVESVIEYESGNTDLYRQLESTKGSFCRVFILYANAEDAEIIYKEIEAHNLTEPGYVWFVSEQALSAPNVPDGIIGVTLANGTDEEAHIHDSVYIIGLGLRELYHNVNITEAPTNCGNTGKSWETGSKFVRYSFA